jgi:hypothetical protein
MEKHHMQPFGAILILAGLLLVGVGALITLFPKIPFLGRLPGDIHYTGEHVKIYFPLGSCILLSVILTLVFRLIKKFF